MLENQLAIEKTDQVFLLGDYITKGPDSAGTLEYIMNLQQDGYEVYALRGNHEQNFLNAMANGPEALKLYLDYYDMKGLNYNGKIRPDVFHFINRLPFYIELDAFYLVHAGLDFSSKNPLEDLESMLLLRDYEPDAAPLAGKHIVHGHQPHYLETIRQRVQQRAPRIPLDNGVAHTQSRSGLDISCLQNLCALDLDAFALYVQPNID